MLDQGDTITSIKHAQLINMPDVFDYLEERMVFWDTLDRL